MNLAVSRTSCLLLLTAVALSAQPADPGAAAEAAKQAMSEGRFAEAAKIYTELYPLAPDNFGMLMNLGMARGMAGQHKAAIEPLEKAVKQNANVFPAQLFLGDSYFALGEFESAAKALEAAAKLEPEHIPARQTLAETYANLGRPAAALPHVEKVSELQPDNPVSWSVLGQTHAQLAQQAFTKLEQTAPESAYMLRLVGDIRFSAQQYPSAFYLYRQALERKPNWRGLHAIIAEIYRRTDRTDWAEAETKKELALGDIDCEAERFECLYAQAKHDELRRAVDKLETAEGHYWKAQVHNVLAEKAIAKLDDMKPSLALHAARGEVAKSRQRYEDAAKHWAAALELEPADPRLEAELTIALYQSRQFDKAEPRLRTLLEKQPNESNWSFMLGDILLNRQQVEEAEPLLAKAAKLDPSLLPAHHALGRAYMQLGRDADAVPHLEKALPLDDDGSLTYQLAQAYRTTGNREAAAPLLERYQAIQAAQRQADEEFQTDIQITAPAP